MDVLSAKAKKEIMKEERERVGEEKGEGKEREHMCQSLSV